MSDLDKMLESKRNEKNNLIEENANLKKTIVESNKKYEMLENDHKQLLKTYNDLKSASSQQSKAYDELKKASDELKVVDSQNVSAYNKLKKAYDELKVVDSQNVSAYNKLEKAYDELKVVDSQNVSAYNDLEETHHETLKQFNGLQDEYLSLKDEFDKRVHDAIEYMDYEIDYLHVIIHRMCTQRKIFTEDQIDKFMMASLNVSKYDVFYHRAFRDEFKDRWQ